MAIWTQRSGTKLAILQEKITTTVNLPVDPGATIELISGEIPLGLRLKGIQLYGTPYEVPRDTVYRFVLRATLNGETSDRTYTIEVQGPDSPVWQTEEDLLAIGNNNSYYILDSAPVDYQLIATDDDTAAGQKLRYFIGRNDGVLPPGLTLTEEGRIVGVVDPILALDKEAQYGFYDDEKFDRYPFDFSIKSSNGFDSFYYDVAKYDYSVPTNVPRKLNRYYQFTVTASDGDTLSKRTFRIFVVGDDYFRTDNTLMQVGTGIFTADNTFIRTPIWLTPSDLGYRRANNYITLYLEIIDINTLTGIVEYTLLDENDDGSPSSLPEGMSLDKSTGEIAGLVPYQPAVTKEYKFTVNATRYTANSDEIAESKKTFTVKLLGEVDSTITWNTNTDLGDIPSNYISTLKVDASSDVPNAILLYTLQSGRLPPGLELQYDGEITGKIRSFGTVETPGLTIFDGQDFLLDGNTTTIDREYIFTVKAQDHFGYSATTKEFKISVADPDDKLYSNIYFKPLLKQDQRTSLLEFTGNPELFPPEDIYRPADPNFGIQRDIKVLVYSGIETVLAERYVAAMAKNTKRKFYKIGDLKTAVAKAPGTNDIVYEVVYLTVVDPYERDGKVAKQIVIKNDNKILVNSVRTTPNDFNYDTVTRSSFPCATRIEPNNVKYCDNLIEIYTREGMVQWVFGTNLYIQSNVDGQITCAFTRGSTTNLFNRPVPENTIRADSDAVLVSDPNKIIKYISNISNAREEFRSLGRTERNFLPLWMRTAQENSIQELGFTAAIPLCYCKPGTAETIAAGIKFSGFDYRQFELDIDRYLIDSTEGISDPKYFVFANYEYNL